MADGPLGMGYYVLHTGERLGIMIMEQDEINRAEWENEDNWGATGKLAAFASVYFSKKDTRTWVPKKTPWLGWTVNLAHRSGVLWGLGFVVGYPVFLILVLVLILLAVLPGS